MSADCLAFHPSSALRAASACLRRTPKAISALGKRYAAYQRTVRELSACSDRELADMGISRFDVRRLAREAAVLAN